eukprot:SAG31_NODE_12185_length_960_cov_1.571429_1_plen_155_part_01
MPVVGDLGSQSAPTASSLRSPKLSAEAAPFQPPRAQKVATVDGLQHSDHRIDVANHQYGVHHTMKARKTVDCYLWSKAVFSGKRPADRSCHSAAMFGQHMYIFGGYGSGKWYNDVRVLDTVTMTWQSRPVSGQPPKVRYAHASFMHADKMYIFVD